MMTYKRGKDILLSLLWFAAKTVVFAFIFFIVLTTILDTVL